MITAATLKGHSRRDLAEMAKRFGVSGWHQMRKDQLVRVLARRKAAAASKSRTVAKPKVTRPASNHGKNGNSPKSAAKTILPRRIVAAPNTAARPVRVRKKTPEIMRRIGEVHAQRERLKDLSTVPAPVSAANHAPARGIKVSTSAKRDRLVLMVRDSYWLHACWEISRQSVERVRVAMAEAWHTARPVLRLLEVESGATTSTAERVLREIPIHGGVSNWYIDVQKPPSSFRVAVGYLGAGGKFHALARSNSVTTPRLSAGDAVDQNWSDVARDCERIYAMSGGYNDESNGGDLRELFEERLRRPMGPPVNTRFGGGAEAILPRVAEFHFDVDAELIICGRTRPDANVAIAGQPVKVRPDGTFSVRQTLPDRRQVLPLVAGSHDGLEQRTVILAVERNTKVMEPVTRESSE